MLVLWGGAFSYERGTPVHVFVTSLHIDWNGAGEFTVSGQEWHLSPIQFERISEHKQTNTGNHSQSVARKSQGGGAADCHSKENMHYGS